MMSELDVLSRVADYHDHIQVPQISVTDDLRRGRRRVRRHRALLTGAMALGVATAVLAATLIDGGGSQRLSPIAPSTPAPSSDWSGPVRPGATALPVVAPKQVRPPSDPDNPRHFSWADGADAAVGSIDIIELRLDDISADGRLDWTLQLRDTQPPTATVDPAQRTIEYGLVVDADGDRTADCQIGINNNAPRRGDYRVWVTNLRTGARDERIGPPYGYPVDFHHPADAGAGQLFNARTLTLWFLRGAAERICDRFGRSAHLYAWASLTQAGRVTAWDYAPSAAWLDLPS